MSFFLEMLQVARLSPQLLGESASTVASFLSEQQQPDGGYCGRGNQSDLYYTSFALCGLSALQAPLHTDRVIRFLRTFENRADLDLVHAAALARCWACVGHDPQTGHPDPLLSGNTRTAILEMIHSYRSPDGGYHHHDRKAGHGTPYGAFLALGAMQDLESSVSDKDSMIASVQACTTPDGAYGNAPGLTRGATPAVAAAESVLRILGESIDSSVSSWLFERYGANGGFHAAPDAPLPDLLSTATALHALSGMQADLSAVKEPCIDFVDSLWSGRGSFHGHWADDELDSEYTFYGLLALGHLRVA